MTFSEGYRPERQKSFVDIMAFIVLSCLGVSGIVWLGLCWARAYS